MLFEINKNIFGVKMEEFDKYWKNILDIGREKIINNTKTKKQQKAFREDILASIFFKKK